MFFRKRGPKERRRGARAEGPALAAFYWTGGISNPCRVCNISRQGAYIETDQEWYVGTVLHLVLEPHASSQLAPDSAKTFGLWARIVHTAPLTNDPPQNAFRVDESVPTRLNALRARESDPPPQNEFMAHESGQHSLSNSRGMGMEFMIMDREEEQAFTLFLESAIGHLV